jgi:pentatricopeptide repeat protein
MPGAGDEAFAPKALDHYNRGYHERAEMRDKEFYAIGDDVGGPPASYKASEKEDYVGGDANESPTQRHSSVSQGKRAEGDASDHYRLPERSLEARRQSGYSAHPSSHGNNNNNNHHHGSGGNNSSNNNQGHGSRHQYSHNDNGAMDEYWGHARGGERPGLLLGLDVTALMDRLGHPRADVFQELDQSRHNHPEVFECGKAMTALISGAARRRQMRLAQACWEYMDARRLEKNVYHYNSMISVAEKNKDYRMALSLMEEMSRRHIEKNEVT